MERFEQIAEIYINGDKEIQDLILSMLDENERKIFLEGVGYYKLFHDRDFYNAARDVLCERVFNACQGGNK